MAAIPLVVADLNGEEEPLDTVLDALALDLTGDSINLAVLTDARPARLATDVAARLKKRGQLAEIVTPPAGGVISRLAAGWTRIPVQHADARFPQIPAMRELVPPRRIMIVLDSEAGHVLPVECIEGYVHPRLAAAVRFSRPEFGAAADVALGFNIAAVVLSTTVNTRPIIAATPDLVAGQLLALALRAIAYADDEDRIGPWEHPVVQRATELGLGVNHPGQLALICLAPEDQAMIELCHRLRLLLGIP